MQAESRRGSAGSGRADGFSSQSTGTLFVVRTGLLGPDRDNGPIVRPKHSDDCGCMIKRIAVFAYGVICYAVFFATFLYAIAFIGNFGVPKTLDGVPRDPFIVALAINLGLLAMFAVQHSVM